MKVVFVSNYFNHHQKPFCEEMYRRLGDDFVFISTAIMREERRLLGYSDERPHYVNISYEDETQKHEAIKLINSADIVIAGSAPNDMLIDRIRSDKLLFRYSERLFKKHTNTLKRMYHRICFGSANLYKKNIYMLCAGAYTAYDFAKIGLYKNRTFKWGYFPETKDYDVDALMKKKKNNTLLWCGRFIDWKHPDVAIAVAKRLKADGYDFRINIIGTGVMKEELSSLTETYGLTDNVNFLGTMPPEQVRTYMEEAGIYLFTSDRGEGWGAVLNEAMNSGCSVVASHAIGSVPFLLHNEENGIIYESGNVDMLYEKVKYLLDHPVKQMYLGKKAYMTIKMEWNAEVAVDRFLKLSDCLLRGDKYPELFTVGPCSKAAQIYDDWFKAN